MSRVDLLLSLQATNDEPEGEAPIVIVDGPQAGHVVASDAIPAGFETMELGSHRSRNSWIRIAYSSADLSIDDYDIQADWLARKRRFAEQALLQAEAEKRRRGLGAVTSGHPSDC